MKDSMSRKGVIATLLKASVAISFTLLLAACGDDSSSNSDGFVSSIEDLGDCTAKLEGDTVFVKGEKSDFVCVKGKWLNVDSLDAIQNGTNREGSSDGSIYELDSDAYVLPPIVAIENKSISGVSQKGPFVTGSTVKLYELDGKTYASTGKSFPGKIASDDGKFSVSSINLKSQYALLEATGYFRNEVTGEKSRGTITLNALTDLSDRKTVNINLLTHLEYDRALHLVKTGINVRSAKKQAEAEIFNAFGIRGKFANSEDMDVFSKGDGNGALLAFSVLMLGEIDEDDESNEAELTERLTKFAMDIEEDGNWDDEKTKAKIADWASSHFYPRDIRENIEDWELGGSIPDFEKYVRNFWYTTYGLGDCATQNNGAVAPIKNKFSKYSKENKESYYKERQYICKNGEWKWATPLDIDSYKSKMPGSPKDGDLWTGPVTGNTYTYDKDAGGWVMASSMREYEDETVSPAELNLGGCTLKREGEVAKASDGIYYICRTDYDLCWWTDQTNMQQCKNGSDSCYSLCARGQWAEASELEYDTYGKPCTSKEVGSVIHGTVNTINKYECKENEREYYLCDENYWCDRDYVWELVYDPYLADTRRLAEEVENPTDGEIRAGYDARYKYDEELDRWEIANRVEKSLYDYSSYYSSIPDFGGCTTKRIGELTKFCGSGGCSYYICGNVIDSECDHDYLCSAHDWNSIDAMEAETYGKECSSDKVGTMINGVVTATYKYYCTANGWVNLMEWNWDVPKEVYLNPKISYGTMTDSRDSQVYKTVKIGTQTWMAENLNYYKASDTTLNGHSWCYGAEDSDNTAYCDVTGRLYTWAAAVGKSEEECGKGHNCNLGEGIIQGVCPSGWHLPDTAEWRILFDNVETTDALRSQTGWIYINEYGYTNGLAGTDVYGFSALPAGSCGFSEELNGLYYTSGWASFWSSTEEESDYDYSLEAYAMVLQSDSESGYRFGYSKPYAFSVRCIKN